MRKDAETAERIAKRQSVEFNGRLVGSLVLFALGGWFAVTQRASFTLGGTEGGTGTRRGTFVDASGLDAIAIGCLIIGLGVINIALGMHSRRRLPVFWAGAALFLWPVLYGLGKFALDVYQFITEAQSSG
jgi:hypothetical protein